METKLLEIRDRATFFAMLCVNMQQTGESEARDYLLGRSGYGDRRLIMCTHAHGGRKAQNDCYEWGDRTFHIAHAYIQAYWDELKDGDVIDVEFILKETKTPKISERFTAP